MSCIHTSLVGACPCWRRTNPRPGSVTGDEASLRRGAASRPSVPHIATPLHLSETRARPPRTSAQSRTGLTRVKQTFCFRGRRKCRAVAAAEWNIMHIHNSQLRKLIFIKSPSFTCTNYFCGENSSHHHAHKHGSTFSSVQPRRLNMD